jgi:serine/threonine protein kinase
LAKLAEIEVGTGLSRQTDDGGPKAPRRDAGAEVAQASHLTRTGVAMGTAPYMSPEQVRGEKLDARTDLFSFGLVLYEMAAGQVAFAGKTVVEVYDAIVNRGPAPPHELNPAVPSKLEEIISKALEKDRELRYHSAGDLRAELKRLKREADSGSSPVEAGILPALAAHPKGVPVPRTLAIRGGWCGLDHCGSSGLPVSARGAAAKSHRFQSSHERLP